MPASTSLQIRAVVLVSLLVAAGAAQADPCDYAPSRQLATLRAAQAGATVGAVSTSAIALAKAAGVHIVTHSSGSLILTGSSGYMAGTLGLAAAGPVLAITGAGVATAALALEATCARRKLAAPATANAGHDTLGNRIALRRAHGLAGRESDAVHV